MITVMPQVVCGRCFESGWSKAPDDDGFALNLPVLRPFFAKKRRMNFQVTIEKPAPRENELVVRKTTDSALTGTSLRLMLHNCGIDTVVVTGVLTDQCVSGTVRSLADESFRVWLVEDACGASTREIQEHELSVLNNIYCHVVSTDELIAAL